MRRLRLVLSALALVMMLIFVGMVTDLSLHGAYVTKDVERFSGANTVATVGSAISQLGLFVLLGATYLGLLQARRQRQWDWFAALLVLYPIAVISLFSAGFTPNILVGLLTLLSPLALLIYSLRAEPAPATALDR